MSSLRDVVRESPITRGTVLPSAVTSLLDSVALPPGPVPTGPGSLSGVGTGTGAGIAGALGAALEGPVNWMLSEQPYGGEGFALRVTGAVAGVGAPVAEVQEARRDELATEPARASMTPIGGPVKVAFVGDLTISGSPTRPAGVVPGIGARALLSTRHMLLPGGLGLTLPSSEIALSTQGARLGAVELIVPTAFPIASGLVLPADLSSIGRDEDVVVPVPRTPPSPDGPHLTGTLRFRLDADAMLSDLVPMAMSVVLELPGGGSPFGNAGPQVPEAIRVRVTASRPPDDPAAMQVAVTAESDGTDGLVCVGESGSEASVAAGVTTVLGPAMAARAGEAEAAALGVLYTAARGFSRHFADFGGMVLRTVTLEASTIDGKIPVTFDVEGAVRATEWTVGDLLTISMERPMRIRWRNVRAVIDVAEGAIEDAIRLDLQGARPDVVDPGCWHVEGLGNLFEVVGSRGGSGSTWFEVDLRFTVDLGPVRVSGTTIRATFAGDNLKPDIGLRGLDAAVDLPGVLRGGGKVSITQSLDAELWAQIVPLRVNGFVAVVIDGPRVVLSSGVDLPAPIMLGPTGLGLYSLAATIGTDSAIPVPEPADPMRSLLGWRPWEPDGLVPRPGDLTLGAAVVVGTVADDGFTANALGVVGVTVPDFALRIGLDAAFLSDRRDGHTLSTENIRKIRDHVSDPGLFVLGGLSATPSAADVGLEAHVTVPYLLKVDIPAAGHFDAAGWWLRLGSDDGIGGVASRPPGPMKAVVFPELGPLEVASGWAFLMIHGNGIDNLAGSEVSLGGFAVAAGIGFHQVFGAKPVVWAEVSASLIAAIGTRPITIWAQGRLAGSVGLGPFRIGLSAIATILLSEGQVDLHLKVCAVVDLFFTELEGCIEIGSDTKPLMQAPPPDPWPLPTVTLADGIGRLLTDPNKPAAGHLIAEDGDAPSAGWVSTPTVWPDTIPLLTFPIAPVVDAGAGVRNEVHVGLSGAGRFQHEWHLTQVLLEKITPVGAEAVPLDAASAWQIPSSLHADAPPALTSDQRQLALLTVQRGLSLVHQAAPADGSIPPNVAHAADACHCDPCAGGAWTFGADARRLPQPRSWRTLERESLVGFPTSWPTFTRGVGFDVISPDDNPVELLAGVAATGLIDDGGIISFADPIEVDATSFDSVLRLWGRTAAVQEEQPPTARHTVLFREPVAEGYLLIDTGLGNADRVTATVTTADGTRPVDIEAADGPHGLWRVIVARAGDSRATAVELSAQSLQPIAILGLWAVSAYMVDNAATAGSDSAALAGLPPETLVDGSARLVLDAESRYRVTVTVAYHDRVDGTTAPAEANSRTMRWFFRTAEKDPRVKAAQTGGPVAAEATEWGDTVAAPWKKNTVIATAKAGFARVDRFDPGFLSRYLTGYTPADHEQFHFTGDPVSATFRAPHIAHLAATMGRGIGLASRCTDQRESDRTFLSSELLETVLNNGVHGSGLSAADLLGAAAAQVGCPALPDGGELTGTLPLIPQTPYELSVGLPLAGRAFKPGDPELDGITFTTSAYRGPVELIEAFNFGSDTVALVSTPTAHGDLAIGAGGDGDPAALAGLVDGTMSDDAELEQALAGIGLPPLRPVAQPRSTVLWAQTAGQWSVVGLLLESPEPLNRPGRMGIHNAAINAEVFPIQRSSLSGTRALWLRRHPTIFAGPAALTLAAHDKGVPFQRQARVEPQPRFLQGPIKAVQA